jgi:hypothetical protein
MSIMSVACAFAKQILNQPGRSRCGSGLARHGQESGQALSGLALAAD